MPRPTRLGVALLFCAVMFGACASPPPAVVENISSPTPTIAPTAAPTPAPTRVPHVIAIDPGHGGEDDSIPQVDGNGNRYREGPQTGVGIFRSGGSMLWEKDLVLEIAQRLRRQLTEMGYTVVLTRTEDRPVNDPPRDVNGDGEIDDADELQARNDIINASGAELFVSIHFNAYGPASRHGITTYYCTDRGFSAQSKVLAHFVHDQVWDAVAAAGHKLHDNTVRDDTDAGGTPGHLALLGPGTPRVPRITRVPGVLIEPVFLTDPEEGRLIQDPAIQQAIAQGLSQAIQAYFTRE